MKNKFLLVLVLSAAFFAAGAALAAMSDDEFNKLCRTGTPEAVEAAIADGAVINQGWHSPLIHAAQNPDIGVMSVLVKNGAEINSSVLRNTVCQSDLNLESILFMIKNGAAVTPEAMGEAASSENPSPELFALLLENGGDINAKSGYDLKYSPLLYAVQRRNLEFVTFLLDNGADPNTKLDHEESEGSDGPPDRIEYDWTPLHYVVADKSDKDLAALLLARGAKVNAKDKHRGLTPLMAALSNRYYYNPWRARDSMNVDMATITLLLDNGADINATDSHGATPLFYAAENSAEAVALLIKKGADANAKDFAGATPLMAAVGQNAAESVQTLLENGADINMRDNEGKTALMHAATGAYDSALHADIADPKIIELLLKNGADPKLVDNDAKTALEYVSENIEGTDIHKQLKELTPEFKTSHSAAEIKLMNTFLSNFTEVDFMGFYTPYFKSNHNRAIRFAILHNYVNNHRTRIKNCTVKDCEWGPLTIEGKYVAESVKKYLDLELSMEDKSDSDFKYKYDGNLYHFAPREQEKTYYARVDKTLVGATGNVRMLGEVYNVNDKNDTLGKFEAVAKPHKFNGKNTWAIISFTLEKKEE